MKRLTLILFLFPTLTLADMGADWKEKEANLVYDIEFCRITSSQFDEKEESKWETLKASYLEARPKSQADLENWTELKKVMLYAKSAENNANRRLESIAAKELYVHEGCYEKLAEYQTSTPWLKKH